MNTDAFKVFDSFDEFVKPKSIQTKLPENLPFGFSVVLNSTLSKMFTNTDHCSMDDEKMQLLSKSIMKIPDVYFSSLVLFIELSFHS